MFNDTLSAPGFDDKDVAWDTDKLKYSTRKAEAKLNETSVGPGGFDMPPPGTPEMSQWLRVGAASSFRKLYRISHKKGLKAGEELTVSINSVFPATGFEKWVVVSTTSFLGGSQLYLGWLYVVLGALVITAATVLGCLARRAPEDRVRYFYSAAEAYDGVGDGGSGAGGNDDEDDGDEGGGRASQGSGDKGRSRRTQPAIAAPA